MGFSNGIQHPAAEPDPSRGSDTAPSAQSWILQDSVLASPCSGLPLPWPGLAGMGRELKAPGQLLTLPGRMDAAPQPQELRCPPFSHKPVATSPACAPPGVEPQGVAQAASRGLRVLVTGTGTPGRR